MVKKRKAGSMRIRWPIALRRTQDGREQPKNQIGCRRPNQGIRHCWQAQLLFESPKGLPNGLEEKGHGLEEHALKTGTKRGEPFSKGDSGKHRGIVNRKQTDR